MLGENDVNRNFMECIILIILIISIFVLNISCKRSQNNSDYKNVSMHNCVIPNHRYPEIRIVVDNKDCILDELTNLIINEEWSTWGSSYNKDKLEITPRFSDMNIKDKIVHLYSNKKRLGDEQSWKVFGLILEKRPIRDNVILCQKTYDLIKNIPGLINAGFSCLEPNSKTPYHNDSDNRFYRVHIPLIVPDVPDDDIRLDVYDDDDQLIKLNWKTDYFIFNDNCFHQAFNMSNRHRIVLLLDIERRD